MSTVPLAPKWYVVYTRPKSEKIVASSISEMGIESFLPLQKVIRQWSDRKKKIEVPIFPNYVFVKVDEVTRRCLFSIKELVKFVSIEKRPVIVNEKEILAIKKLLDENVDISSEDFFQQGTKIKIVHGQFSGFEGIVIRNNGTTRLLIKIEAMVKAYSFNIPTKFIEPV